MRIDRRLIINFDWSLLTLTFILCAIGVVNLYSAGHSLITAGAEPYYVKQIKWILLGFLFLLLAFLIDYRFLTRQAYWIYAFSLALLTVVLVWGKTVQGAQRWIYLFGFTFQPSELAKIALILALARYFEDRGQEIMENFRDLFIPLILLALPFLLTLKQPHLGNSFILAVIFLVVVFCVGMKGKLIIRSLLALLPLLPLAWWMLRDYQKERIISYLQPASDPLGAGYHTMQSVIAIGSGQLTGKGLLAGSQTQLKFLPEQQTDFIFSVLAEEWGFIGAMIVLLLLVALVSLGMRIAVEAKEVSGAVIALGVTTFIAVAILVNIGMVLGLLPVVGIPLPFLSYGGSSVLVVLTGIGLLLNVRGRRFLLQT